MAARCPRGTRPSPWPTIPFRTWSRRAARRAVPADGSHAAAGGSTSFSRAAGSAGARSAAPPPEPPLIGDRAGSGVGIGSGIGNRGSRRRGRGEVREVACAGDWLWGMKWASRFSGTWDLLRATKPAGILAPRRALSRGSLSFCGCALQSERTRHDDLAQGDALEPHAHERLREAYTHHGDRVLAYLDTGTLPEPAPIEGDGGNALSQGWLGDLRQRHPARRARRRHERRLAHLLRRTERRILPLRDLAAAVAAAGGREGVAVGLQLEHPEVRALVARGRERPAVSR